MIEGVADTINDLRILGIGYQIDAVKTAFEARYDANTFVRMRNWIAGFAEEFGVGPTIGERIGLLFLTKADREIVQQRVDSGLQRYEERRAWVEAEVNRRTATMSPAVANLYRELHGMKGVSHG